MLCPVTVFQILAHGKLHLALHNVRVYSSNLVVDAMKYHTLLVRTICLCVVCSLHPSTSETLLLPPIDFPQETLKHTPLQPPAFIHVLDHFPYPSHNILFVIQIYLLQLQLCKNALYPPLLFGILAPIAFIQHFPLFRTRSLQRLIDDPRALVVLDVRADFPNCLWGSICVEVVVLDLKVFTQGDEDVLAGFEVGGRGELEVMEGEDDGEVEGVVSRFVDDDEAVLFRGEIVEIDVVFWCGEEVAQLTDFRLEGCGLEKLKHVHVTGMLSKVFLEERVDGHFQHEGVVYGDHAYARLAIPAWLAAAGDGGVHYVVGDEEEGLQELGEPAQGCGEEVFGLVERAGEEEGGGVGDGEAAVAFPAHCVVVE